MTTFQAVVDAILEDRWARSPITASMDGIHGRDGEMDRMDRDAILEDAVKARGHLQALRDTAPSTPEERLDRAVLDGALEWSIAETEEVRNWEKDPGQYPGAAIYSVYMLAMREFAPMEARAEFMRRRLEQFPRVLKEGRANLKQVPRVFGEVAVQNTEGGLQFLDSFIPQVAGQVPTLRDGLFKAARTAKDALSGYLDFLKSDILPHPAGTYAIGRELFDKKLRLRHQIPFSAEELAGIGREAVEEVDRALGQAARKVTPGASWREVVAHLKHEHPPEEGIIQAYRDAAESAKRFVLDKGLVDLPPGERLEIIPTPLFERAILPYAAMMPPAPFEQDQKSLFYVTPVDGDLPDAVRREKLRDHCLYGIPITALHEGIPGHHLQLSTQNRLASRVRRIFDTPVFVEGWALYCEQMMEEEGFLAGPLGPGAQVFRLKDLLWRACRVVVDTGLHTGGMTEEAAVDFLVERGGLERSNARLEVNRYCAEPTQPMSYYIGRREILRLREDWKARQGSAFTLKGFHSRVLSYGGISPWLIRGAMFGHGG